MPNSTKTLPFGTWTLLTPGVGRITNTGSSRILVQANSSAVTAPVDAEGALFLDPGETILGDFTMAILFPGNALATHLWGLSESGGEASVSHE